MSENRWGSMGGDEDRDYYKTRADSLSDRLEKAEAELADEHRANNILIEQMESLARQRDRLKDALEPFVEIWKKRSGPGQPSISSGMGVASPVKYYINAEDALAGGQEEDKPFNPMACSNCGMPVDDRGGQCACVEEEKT